MSFFFVNGWLLSIIFSVIRMFYTPFYKLVSGAFHPYLINIISSVLGAVILLLILRKFELNFKLLVLYVVTELGGIMITLAISLLRAVSSVAFLQTIPIFVGIISALYLKELPSKGYWVALILASIGGLMYKLSSFEPNFGFFVMIVGIILFALGINVTRKYVQKISPLNVLFHSYLVQIGLNAILAIIFTVSLTLDFFGLIQILVLGLILLSTSLLANYAMKFMKSYEFALITSILTFIGSILLSIFWLGESLTLQQTLAVLIMLLSGLLASYQRAKA